MPRAIFEYRDKTKTMKLVDRKDGIPPFLYKGLISTDALEEDHLSIISTQTHL